MNLLHNTGLYPSQLCKTARIWAKGGGGGGGGGQGHGLLGWGVKTHLPLRMLSLLLAEVQLLRRRFVP